MTENWEQHVTSWWDADAIQVKTAASLSSVDESGLTASDFMDTALSNSKL